ncbi:LLM class flavin-dependent oxidoreductase [Streptomyces sp. NBC_01476]|uniref:LLM class flavin-dependent oxidoreductase n=1 Tax=Streptomyces sp. NBC_01476 TaxID=2903881 RepID=UPI002E34341C|nr:LLM class flavin-dependent oxidoreductase [Streptomyces sp. NBC_01476]
MTTPAPATRPNGDAGITIGLDTFGDVTNAADGSTFSHAQTIRGLVEEGVLADGVGLDYFGIGEHHTDAMPLSAADVVLSAIAARTGRIHLGSAVTVISSDDPVRVFQRYATLDAVSGGRAEVILGRGSSTESFPLFGYDLGDYERLFEEKLDLFAELLKEKPVVWSGDTRPPLNGLTVYPHTESGPIPTWVGVGGSPQSVVRTARYGFSLMLAIIGGETARFAPFAGLFAQALEKFGQPARPVGVHAPGHVAATDEQAVEEFLPAFEAVFRRVSRERGFHPPTRESLARDIGPGGALHIGSPETVARKITGTLKNLGATRFDLKYGMNGMPHSALMTSIELYGTKVAPLVRDMMSDS